MGPEIVVFLILVLLLIGFAVRRAMRKPDRSRKHRRDQGTADTAYSFGPGDVDADRRHHHHHHQPGDHSHHGRGHSDSGGDSGGGDGGGGGD